MVVVKDIGGVVTNTITPLAKIHRYEDVVMSETGDGQIPALYMRYVKRFINPDDGQNRLRNIHFVLKLLQDIAITLDMTVDDLRDAVAVNQMRYEATAQVIAELKNDSRRITTIASRMDNLDRAITIINYMADKDTERMKVDENDLTERL